jgi:hypothetical protein
MKFTSQDSYDVIKDGRFLGRMNILIRDPDQKYFQFELRQTFADYWRDFDRNSVEETVSIWKNRIEMPLVKFYFCEGDDVIYRRIFDASGVPVEALYRVACFQPAY